MTLQDRRLAFAARFPQWPAAWPYVVQEQGRDVLYGIWVIGNNYRATNPLYGSYPPNYVARVLALYPTVGDNMLHAFSGALAPGPYSRIDLVDRCGVPDRRFHQGDVCDVARIFDGRCFDLVMADPPYSADDAARYQTPSVDRPKTVAALASVVRPGGHLAWLDTCWPMHSKKQWVTVGRILVQRSTNHRVRVLTLFERVGLRENA